MLRNYWYIACASSKLGLQPLAARILDQDLVIFRDSNRKPHALLDRCCHRGVRLSLGKVVDGTLACGYHGWQYNGLGKCIHIPSLVKGRRIPEGFEVPSFRCFERDSYIWIWMGDGEPHPTEPDAIEGLDQHPWLQGSISYQCDVMKLIENNVDWCHPAFTHEGTHAAYFRVQAVGFTEYQFEVRLTERGFVILFPATSRGDEPIPDSPPVLISFRLPGVVRIDARSPNMSYTVIMHFVPTNANASRMEWMMTATAGSGVTWMDGEPTLFTQDRIVESSQEWYERCGGDFERSVEADVPTLLARQIMRLAESGEWEGKRLSLSQRRLVSVRS